MEFTLQEGASVFQRIPWYYQGTCLENTSTELIVIYLLHMLHKQLRNNH